jgi:nucleotide-binding universal stress UspA family protein
MFQRILVPVDLTHRSLPALDQALALASGSRSEVTLLHVIETIEHVPFDELKDFYRRLETRARKGLAEVSARFEEKKVKVDAVVNFGHRTQTIVDTAQAKKADLIVMASHRIDPERPGYGWGTISYGVAIMAPCAVLLVK